MSYSFHHSALYEAIIQPILKHALKIEHDNGTTITITFGPDAKISNLIANFFKLGMEFIQLEDKKYTLRLNSAGEKAKDLKETLLSYFYPNQNKHFNLFNALTQYLSESLGVTLSTLRNFKDKPNLSIFFIVLNDRENIHGYITRIKEHLLRHELCLAIIISQNISYEEIREFLRPHNDFFNSPVILCGNFFSPYKKVVKFFRRFYNDGGSSQFSQKFYFCHQKDVDTSSFLNLQLMHCAIRGEVDFCKFQGESITHKTLSIPLLDLSVDKNKYTLPFEYSQLWSTLINEIIKLNPTVDEDKLVLRQTTPKGHFEQFLFSIRGAYDMRSRTIDLRQMASASQDALGLHDKNINFSYLTENELRFYEYINGVFNINRLERYEPNTTGFLSRVSNRFKRNQFLLQITKIVIYDFTSYFEDLSKEKLYFNKSIRELIKKASQDPKELIIIIDRSHNFEKIRSILREIMGHDKSVSEKNRIINQFIIISSNPLKENNISPQELKNKPAETLSIILETLKDLKNLGCINPIVVQFYFHKDSSVKKVNGLRPSTIRNNFRLMPMEID